MIKNALIPVFLLIGVLTGPSCKKNALLFDNKNQIEIYLLKSYNVELVSVGNTKVSIIKNPVPETTAALKNSDIISYNPADYTFRLEKSFPEKFYTEKKAFVVMVNNQPVYYGYIWPLHYSSMAWGIPYTLGIGGTNKKLTMYFNDWHENNTDLKAYDTRNNEPLIKALMATGRLR